MCDKCCTDLEPDYLPRSSNKHPGIYIARPFNCHSQECREYSGRRIGIPLDPEIPWCKSLEGDSAQVYAAQKLIRQQGAREGFPSSIELWCSRRKDETRINRSNTQARAIDHNPHWTKGERAKYVLRPFTCINCNCRQFVPINGTITYIGRRALYKFDKQFYFMDDDTMIAHLSARPSSNLDPTKADQKRGSARRTVTRKGAELLNFDYTDNATIPSLKHDDLTKAGPSEKNIKLVCKWCHEDTGARPQPEWCIRTGEYIARRKKYCPNHCAESRGRKIWCIPQNLNTPYITADRVQARLRKVNQLNESIDD
jgi:hypothetical protein